MRQSKVKFAKNLFHDAGFPPKIQLPSIDESYHPKRDLSAGRRLYVIGKNIGILHSGYLRKAFIRPANLNGIFSINLKIAPFLAIFHFMGIIL